MKQQFVIFGRLPGWNEIASAARTHWAKAHNLKGDAMGTVALWARSDGIVPVADGCEIHIKCYEPNLRRDIDNIESGAKKVILDALQRMGILRNDNRKGLKSCTATTDLDRENPRIVVDITGEPCERHLPKGSQL